MDLFINTYGTRIRSSGERIVLKFPNKTTDREYPIRRLEKIIILRPSSISTGAVQLALKHDVDIVYLGSFGKPVGRIFSSEPYGLAKLRRAQLEFTNSPRAFELAKAFVLGKCKNQILYLYYLQKHYHKSFQEKIIRSEAFIQSLELIIDNPKGRDQLFGIEGLIADRYFACFKELVRFPGRNPKGRDKFNSALNYGYGILYNEVERACLYTGLDPYLGLYHADRYGKPALVLDLVEKFRVPIIDSIVLPLFIEKQLTKQLNFISIGNKEYRLALSGKRLILEGVLQRLNQRTLWGSKRQTLKSVIMHQVRTLSHVFLGKKGAYEPFLLEPLLNA